MTWSLCSPTRRTSSKPAAARLSGPGLVTTFRPSSVPRCHAALLRSGRDQPLMRAMSRSPRQPTVSMATSTPCGAKGRILSASPLP
jgi:hypothetical protein